MFHMTFNNQSGWKLLKACRKCIFSEYLYTLHVCKHLFLVWQGFFFSLTSFAYVKKKKKRKKKKGKKKKKWWAVLLLVMFTWIDWNLTWKFNQSSVLMQNNDNFKQTYSAKNPAARDVISCREWEAAMIFTQELYLHFSRWNLVD